MLTWDINVIPLLNSKILFQQFDFDQWPNIHHVDSKMIEPYNDSIFNVSQQYPIVFKNLCQINAHYKKDELVEEVHNHDESTNTLVHKIRYTLSVLPNMRDS